MIVAFDFDGTICDSMPQLEELAVRVLRYHLTDYAARLLYRDTTGLPFEEQVRLMLPAIPLEIVNEFAQGKKDVYQTAQPFMDAWRALGQLRKLPDVDVVLVSSTLLIDSSTWLDKHHLRHYFDHVCGVGGPKDRQLRYQHADMFVGDSWRDLEFADKAGTGFIAVHGESGIDLLQAVELIERTM